MLPVVLFHAGFGDFFGGHAGFGDFFGGHAGVGMCFFISGYLIAATIVGPWLLRQGLFGSTPGG